MTLKAYQHQLGLEDSKIMTNYQLSRGSDSPVECDSLSSPFSLGSLSCLIPSTVVPGTFYALSMHLFKYRN